MSASAGMRALRWHGRHDVRVDVVPVPRAKPGEVLVEVELCGVCGTDVQEVREGPLEIPVAAAHPLTGQRAPVTLGHEVVGRVVEARDGGPPAGTRVIPDVVAGCGSCWWCRRHQPGLCERLAVLGLQGDGGLARYMVASAATCVSVPDQVPPEVAVFAEPTAVAVRAVRKLGDLSGQRLAVVGLGTIGQLTSQVALAAGAGAVIATDPVDERRRVADRPGVAPEPPDRFADAVLEATDGRGADGVLECSGAPDALASGLRSLRRGGTLVAVGLPSHHVVFDLRAPALAEQRIVGTAAHVWDEDVAAAMSLLAAGHVKVDRIPTRRISLDTACTMLADPPGDVLKLLVDPRERS